MIKNKVFNEIDRTILKIFVSLFDNRLNAYSLEKKN